MKKVLACLCALTMLFSLVACGGGAASSAADSAAAPVSETEPASDASATETADATTQHADKKVVAILPGPITDNGWNAGAFAGLEGLNALYGCQTEYVENVAVSDAEDFLRGYGNQGFTMVVVHGSQFIDVVNAVAPDYPDTYFLTTYAGEPLSTADNHILAGPVGSGIMSGIVAGALTETGQVAFLGGEMGASISPIVNEFDDGVALVNPDAVSHTHYIGSLTDQGMAKEQALTLIAQEGIDVISATANAAGIGVLQAAEEKGITALGFNADQHSAAPGAVVVSVTRDFGQIFKLVFAKIVDGSVEPKGLYPLSIKDGVITLTDWYGDVPQEKKDLVEQTIQKIINGEIDEAAIIAANAAI